MRTNYARRDRLFDEHGFTLIEMLVVIIIIGILALIAIPVYLSQRQQAYSAAVKSDLRNAANFEELYLTDTGSYGPLGQVQLTEPKLNVSKGDTVTLVLYEGDDGYCLSASHSGSSTTWYYDSRSGGLQPNGSTGCPVTTGGTPGDSISG
jgi:prepilin-type N-terminal cleavage/methylation domain-containing protein